MAPHHLDILRNPHLGSGLPPSNGLARGNVSADPAGPASLLAHCPAAAVTPLHDLPGLAERLGVGCAWLKDETARMGLGSFKALGAAAAIAQQAAEARGQADWSGALHGRVYVCASAGNHGLSVAAGARVFGARAVVYLGDGVPEAFAARLRARGAEIVRPGGDYEASMRAAAADAEREGWTLLSDSSWPGYVELPERVMEGYLVMAAEIAEQVPSVPTHVLLQAGVGGLAAAMCAYFRACWGDGPKLLVVEPDTAPALLGSIRAGEPVATTGPVSCMGRLDCKEPSHLALAELARGADWFLTVSDSQAREAATLLGEHGIETTPSGAAGVAAILNAGEHFDALGLSGASRVLVFATEGREDVQ